MVTEKNPTTRIYLDISHHVIYSVEICFLLVNICERQAGRLDQMFDLFRGHVYKVTTIVKTHGHLT
jgi:hypothetical protein